MHSQGGKFLVIGFLFSLKTSNSALSIVIYEKSKSPTHQRKRKLDTVSKPNKAPELPNNQQNNKYKIQITVKDILYQPAIIGSKTTNKSVKKCPNCLTPCYLKNLCLSAIKTNFSDILDFLPIEMTSDAKEIHHCAKCTPDLIRFLEKERKGLKSMKDILLMDQDGKILTGDFSERMSEVSVSVGSNSSNKISDLPFQFGICHEAEDYFRKLDKSRKYSSNKKASKEVKAMLSDSEENNENTDGKFIKNSGKLPKNYLSQHCSECCQHYLIQDSEIDVLCEHCYPESDQEIYYTNCRQASFSLA